MGHVYRAEDLRLPGRLCAIKEIRPDENTTPEIWAQSQAQFLQEASILAQLDHPNLPKVSDFFTEGGRDYLVMDFVPGLDLKQVLEESLANGRFLSPKTVLQWVHQIVDALSYLHAQDPPILHRDIKPANIKLTPDGRIKLVDFGLVKLLRPDDSRTITIVQGRGTALYTPLEQYGGTDNGHTDVRTDIYALGATCYHLLTGNPPPDAKSRFLNPAILHPPHQENPQLPPILSEAIMWSMEMHPDTRPQDINTFYLALQGKIKPPQAVNLPFGQAVMRLFLANWGAWLITLGLFFLAVIATLFYP